MANKPMGGRSTKLKSGYASTPAKPVPKPTPKKK